jgi:hypothetical protein
MGQSAKLERQSLNTYATTLHNFHAIHEPKLTGPFLFHNHHVFLLERVISFSHFTLPTLPYLVNLYLQM